MQFTLAKPSFMRSCPAKPSFKIFRASFSLSAYCVVVAESASRQISIAFLERVNEDFNKRYGGGKAATVVAHGLS
ncbi:hypothetical protein G4B88_005501 [Cannabis sativa]|uniref:Longin domain-containing protein n=1 Tax=Cannabis sativa TaxID=3483 RepID=A0A7J6HA36_CANSA|nr:hypothetical protein G4B88_005501 [Cannabis sativa]